MKRFLAMMMAAAMVVSLASVSAFASGTYDMPYEVANGLDEDGNVMSAVVVAPGQVSADSVKPENKIYIPLPASTPVGGIATPISEVYDADNFTFKLDRDQNGKYLDTVKFVSRRLGNAGVRADYIEVILKSSSITEDVKVSFDVYFRAKGNPGTGDTGTWTSGDRVNTRFELWVQNDSQSGDANVSTGEGFVFTPNSNEENIITWGGEYDVASLSFTANSDAKKFYTKLSTKTDADIYAEYGDPSDADLYFRDFGGHPNIDAAARATLTLYNPWSEDGDNYDGRYDFDPRDAYIYRIVDGYLEDITNLFTYVNGDETETGTDGWTIRVRTLDSYVISDTELMVDDNNYDGIDAPADTAPRPAPGTPGPLPSTGSSDMVAGAVLLLSLSCAVTFVARKRK